MSLDITDVLCPPKGIIKALAGGAAGGSAQNDQMQQQYNEMQQKLQEQEGAAAEDRARQEQQLNDLEEGRKAMQDQLDWERSEQPQGSKDELVLESRERWHLQTDKRNVLCCGLSGSGKTSVINSMARLTGSRDEMATKVTENTEEPEARSLQKLTADLSDVVIQDSAGSGTDRMDANALKQVQPAGFDLVLTCIDKSMTKGDCAIIQFCHNQQIPWAIVKPSISIAGAMQGSDEEAKQKIVEHVEDVLKLRGIPFDRVFFVNARTKDQFYAGQHDEKDLLKLVAGPKAEVVDTQLFGEE